MDVVTGVQNSRSGNGREGDGTKSPTCWVWSWSASLQGCILVLNFLFWRCLHFPKIFHSGVMIQQPSGKSDIVPFFAIQCSKSCQGGFRVREVRCLSDDMAPGSLCDPQLKPEERESCNPQDCVPEVGEFGVPIWEKRERSPL